MHVDQGPNCNSLASGAITISSNPTQGPNIPIPDGYEVLIKAKDGNTGTCYIETSNSTSTTKFALLAGEFVTLSVTNLNLIWFSDTVSTDVIMYLVEQRS